MTNTHSYRDPAYSARRRGNVLVLVVVVLGLLALLGGAYLQTARVQRQMFFDSEDCAPLARMFVIEDIKDALKSDVFNPENGTFFDVTNGMEAYDRAWTNASASYDVLDVSGNTIGQALGNENDDTWLASALPVLEGGTWRWRQISTLNGAWFDTNGDPDVNDRRIANEAASGGDPDANDIYGNGGSLRPGIDFNIDAFTDTSLVDADADGLPDSRLERITSFPIKNGVEYFAAVRIIDLASFLNINTALSSVDPMTGDSVGMGSDNDAPRGNNPSELNLGNVVRNLTNPANANAFSAETTEFIDFRGADGTDFAGDRENFWERVGRRLGNPANNTNVLGDADEAQLRHRGGAFNRDGGGDDVTDATNGIRSVLNQGVLDQSTNTATFGTDGINTLAEADGFFPYDAVDTTGTRTRFTVSSGEAIYGVPTPRETEDFPNQRVLRTALNNPAFGLSFNYPPADPGVTPTELEDTLGNGEAFAAGQDSDTTPVARPGARIQDNAEALTELASDIKTIFNNAFSTSKAVAGAEPQSGVATLAPSMVGNNGAPAVFGSVVATNESQVNLFATQFAANFEDYLDDDNILTVLDVDGLPTADRDPDDTRLFPLNNTWSDVANLDGGLPADTGPASVRFGFELLPYITEVYVQSDYDIDTVTGPQTPDQGGANPDFNVTWDSNGPAGVGYAIEIRNPFNTTISLNNVHLYVGTTPGTPGTLLPDGDEWTTTTTGVTAARADADFDGDDLDGTGGVTDYDLADLVTNQLRLSNSITDEQSKTQLEPNEVLILYRNGNAGADDNDLIVNRMKFANATAVTGGNEEGPGHREGSNLQWDGGVTANSIPADSAIDDRAGNQTYTYVELPIDWPTAGAAPAGNADFPADNVTVELRIAAATEPNGFSSGVTGGDDGSTATGVPRLARVRYQVVDSSIAPVESFTNTHLDLQTAPLEDTRVTMQHSTVGNANGLNAMLVRRGDFQNREVFPDQFDVALTGSGVNNDLAELIAPAVVPAAAPIVTRVAVYNRLVAASTETAQVRLGNDEKAMGAILAGYEPSTAGGSNANMAALNGDQVVMRNGGAIQLESEIAHLLLLGIEPVGTNPLESGSTADSFINTPQLFGSAATPDSLNDYRLNFGLNTALPLPAASGPVNDDNDHWNKPHARFLLERVTALSPARDGQDNDGDGRTDEADEQFLAGRLNINQAEPELIRDALPFGNPLVRDDYANVIEALRGDDNAATAPEMGILHAWDLFDEPATPTLAAGSLTDGETRIDFLQNNLGGDDGASGDAEEAFLLTGNAQQVLTTRSDVYVAYILVQGYRDANANGDFTDGPGDGLIEQERSIVLFDRSGLINSADEVESRVIFEFDQ